MMKKTIAVLLLTVLCLTVLTSCDFSKGLVGELFGEQPADVGELSGDVIDAQPAIPGGYYTKIPKLVKVGYLSAVLITDGGRQTIELANADALQNWSGYLEFAYDPDAVLLIKAYACYDDSDFVSYRYLVENSVSYRDTLDIYTIDEIERKQIGKFDADYVQGIYVKIPMEAFAPGSNMLYIFGDPTNVTIDGWVLEEHIEIFAYTADDEVWIEPIEPIETETVAPEVEETLEETVEEMTYPAEDTTE